MSVRTEAVMRNQGKLIQRNPWLKVQDGDWANVILY